MGRRRDYDEFQEWLEFQHEENPDAHILTRKIVCPSCDGRGHYVNPSIDGNGISAEEWENDWDEESREMYLNGSYDVVCGECHGNNVVDALDEERVDPALVQSWKDWQRSEAAYRAEVAAEIRMGA